MRVKVREKDVVLSEPESSQKILDVIVLARIIRKTSDSFHGLDSPSNWTRVPVDANEVIILNSPVHRDRFCGL